MPALAYCAASASMVVRPASFQVAGSVICGASLVALAVAAAMAGATVGSGVGVGVGSGEGSGVGVGSTAAAPLIGRSPGFMALGSRWQAVSTVSARARGSKRAMIRINSPYCLVTPYSCAIRASRAAKLRRTFSVGIQYAMRK